jgi:hypothetical protein
VPRITMEDDVAEVMKEETRKKVIDLARKIGQMEDYGVDIEPSEMREFDAWKKAYRALCLGDTLDEGQVWLCAYDVTREFGGHEEGGWWYDDWTFVEVVNLEPDEDGAFDQARAMNRREQKSRGRYDRYSVLGGADRVYHIDRVYPGQSARLYRPHYC